MVVLKLDAQGAYQWHSFYGCGFADAGAAVAADSQRSCLSCRFQ